MKSHALPCTRLLLATFLAFLGPTAAAAQTITWPQKIIDGKTTVVIYQPQVDSLRGDQLYSRSAISVQTETKGELVFGAIWSTARLLTDRDAGTATVIDLKVTRVRFPDATPEQEQTLTRFIENGSKKWALVSSLRALEAGLAASERERANAAGLNAEPPVILLATKPTVLILIDGEPVLRPIENTSFQRVVNTAYAMVYDPSAKTYYLSGGRRWYYAGAATGPWRLIKQVPTSIERLVPPDSAAAKADTGAVPEIVVATRPTELIVTMGEPDFSPITGTDLLYVTNSQNSLFKFIQTQDYFVLLSGRWFAARELTGPWRHIMPDSLPADFARIPPESPAADVLVSVPGTPQAEDALANAAIPQTAAVRRSEAELEVKYDGEPRFDSIPGTGIRYAVNTATSVLLVDGRYYACSQAVWFTSASATGPWVVADSVPREIQNIPPSSPVYNVKYVQVYESTPEVVYVGYTPGYVGVYPYYGTVVYGTGWYYPPYYGPIYYYPRPYTYGFHVCYNPWTGWGFGMTWSYGFMTIGVAWGGAYRPPYYGGWYGGGWYGPGGYRPPPPGYRPGYPGYRPPPGYHPPGARPPGGGYPGNRPPAGGARPTPYPSHNIYNRPENRPMVSQQPSTRTVQARPATGTRDNVFVDNSGNVYRKTDKGWEGRAGNGWGPANAQPSTQPAARPSQPAQPQPRPVQPAQPQQRPSQPGAGQQFNRDFQGSQQLNRDYQARQRASQPVARTGGGAARGGGGRRR